MTTETDTDDTEKWWEDRNLKFNTSDEELDSEHEREEEPNEQQVEPNEEQVEPNEKQDEPEDIRMNGGTSRNPFHTDKRMHAHTHALTLKSTR